LVLEKQRASRFSFGNRLRVTRDRVLTNRRYERRFVLDLRLANPVPWQLLFLNYRRKTLYDVNVFINNASASFSDFASL